ncbi:ABC transporter substrate-binding protein [Xanthobacter sp. KR7-225]|uniref:ABC transporter substrate-binding protein n=1 Tax=Xanthobacter sp. KR7-225 TaxID=3156613 RepID=UPI0032B62332
MRRLLALSLLLGALGAAPGALAQSAPAQGCAPKVSADHLVAPGKLQMSINPTLPPQQFLDEKGELQGLNAELGKAIAAKLCLEPEFVRMDMPPMIPALKARRFDAINTGLFWTEERSKLLFMIPYAQQAISIYTLPDSPLKIAKFEDLSGHSVGIETATYQERQAKVLNERMVAQGLKPIDFRSFKTASETTAALKAGQIEAGINIDETARVFEEKGLVKIWVQGLNGTDITLDFIDRPLAEAVAKALAELSADGTYDKLFDKFKMTRLKDRAFAIRGTGPAQ